MAQQPLETRMVDISQKTPGYRRAKARAVVRMQPETLQAISDGQTPKGDVLSIAQIAGIQGAKRCADTIPLCHPLLLKSVDVKLYLEPQQQRVRIEAEAIVNDATGVEMEALCAVSAAALTLYDMCKGMDQAMVIESMYLLEKEGGRSGHFQHPLSSGQAEPHSASESASQEPPT